METKSKQEELKMSDYIGFTLLFSKKEEVIYKGVLKSYVLSVCDLADLKSAAKRKAEEQIDAHYQDYEYLGLEDIFLVSGLPSEGQILGRTSFYDFKSLEQARSLVLSEEDYPFDSTASNALFYSTSLVYFYNDPEGEDYNFALTIFTVLDVKSHQDAKFNSLRLSVDRAFLARIVELSVEDLEVENLEFVGIEQVCPIFEDITLGGAFQTFYQEFQSKQEVESQLPEESYITEKAQELFDNNSPN